MIAPPTVSSVHAPYVLTFTVRPNDDLHRIVRDMLIRCGYPDISSFEADIRAENPTVGDWQTIAVGSRINLPSTTTTTP